MDERAHILVVEDEADILDGLKRLLDDQYKVTTANGGLQCLKSVVRDKPDLVLLDINMPDLDGFQVCKSLRFDKDYESLPIIFLTAYDTSNDRTKAFELGADDYISKPFENEELLARVKRKLTKGLAKVKPNSSSDLSVGNLQMDTVHQSILINNVLVRLSPLEFRLLRMFVESYGKILSRTEIIKYVWQGQDVSDRIVDPHLVTLRKKLKDFNHQIVSVYRGGYILK